MIYIVVGSGKFLRVLQLQPWTIIHAKVREDICSNKNVFMQELNFDRLVCMAAICYNGPITAVPTNKPMTQETGKKRTCTKLRINISKRHVYTYRQTWLNRLSSSCRSFIYIIYFVGGLTFLSGYYKLRGKLNIPCSMYKRESSFLFIYIYNTQFK